MRYRPIRENYAKGIYGEIDYNEMLVRIYVVISRFLFPYQTWIKIREESKDEYGEKLCYCGHTHKCTCSNPDKKLFKESVNHGSIILWDKENGWKNGL